LLCAYAAAAPATTVADQPGDAAATSVPAQSVVSGGVAPPHAEFHISGPISSDPLVDAQWGLLPASGNGIGAAAAWTLSTGVGVSVAVIDTGVDAAHEDLAGKVAGGASFTGGDPSTDPNGHGTEVAGIIAAIADNGLGIAGVAPGASIVPIQAMNVSGDSVDDVAGDNSVYQAIELAGADGVRVANLSVATTPMNWAQRPTSNLASYMADEFAKYPNTLYVVAAGNSQNDNDDMPVFPCNVVAANVICVGATKDDGTLAGYSDYGATSVQVLAPGDDIETTIPSPPGYGSGSGSSFAAAFVSGEAALLLARKPTLTPPELIALISDGARRTPALSGLTASGAADADASLRLAITDDDGDGISNVFDQCPESYGTQLDGCPAADIPQVTPTPTPTAPSQATPVPTPVATATPVPRTVPAPKLRSFTAKVTKCRRGRPCKASVRVTIKADRRAAVSLSLTRRRCTVVKKTHKRRCRWTTVLTRAFTANTRATSVTVRGAKALTRGRYRAVAVLSADGVKSRPATRAFTVG